VRLARDHIPADVPFYYLRLEVGILKGVEDFDAAVARICFPKTDLKATRSPFLSREMNRGGDAQTPVNGKAHSTGPSTPAGDEEVQARAG
jgi:hypothetical protein